MDPHILQLLYSLRAVVLDGVRDRDDAQQFFILSEEQRRFAILGQAVRLRFDLLRDSHFGLDERLAAGEKRCCGGVAHSGCVACSGGVACSSCATRGACCASAKHARQPVARERLKIINFSGCDALLLRIADDGFSQRMFALLLQRVRHLHQLLFGGALCREDVGHLRLSAGDGAGFIQRNDLHIACFLQRFRIFEQDAVACADAVAHHDGDRRCQS